MSEENQSGKQPQASSDNQGGATNDNAPPQPQAVEPRPKPEPSYGIEKLHDTKANTLTLEKRDKSE